jgi:hypothetical protein
VCHLWSNNRIISCTGTPSRRRCQYHLVVDEPSIPTSPDQLPPHPQRLDANDFTILLRALTCPRSVWPDSNALANARPTAASSYHSRSPPQRTQLHRIKRLGSLLVHESSSTSATLARFAHLVLDPSHLRHNCFSPANAANVTPKLAFNKGTASALLNQSTAGRKVATLELGVQRCTLLILQCL